MTEKRYLVMHNGIKLWEGTFQEAMAFTFNPFLTEDSWKTMLSISGSKLYVEV